MGRVFREAHFPVRQFRGRTLLLGAWFSLVVMILGIKAVSQGWFAHRQPLNLDGQPALLFFNVARGCDCQMLVLRNADAQVAAWLENSRAGVPIYPISLEGRRDLARRYQVIRAPALLLLNETGEVVWRQDGAISSDLNPFELSQFEAQIHIMTK